MTSGSPHPCLTIKPIDKGVEPAGALLIDRSDTGIAIVTSLYLPIGSQVEICGDDPSPVIAEVVDICEEFDEWEWSGKLRMGLRFIN